MDLRKSAVLLAGTLFAEERSVLQGGTISLTDAGPLFRRVNS